MKKIFCLFVLVAHVACGQVKTQNPNIIPEPVNIQFGKGQFIISKKTVIAARDEADRKTAEYFNEYLQQVYGFKLDIDRQEGKNYIRLTTKKFIQAPDKDAYSLTVNKEGISIEGDTYAGTFYGIQTLIQLLPSSMTSPLELRVFSVPFVTIQDYPRFGYRGMHLDVCRHFFPVSFIKKYINYLALHKLNYFHWHLTDDQGWRIEIKKYPELMTTAASRNGTIVGRYPGTGNDNLKYGGYYTQDEVKEIVAYALDRHITVIPEIEMPGHASAAIAAFPWLSCFPEKETKIPSHPSEASKKATGKKVQETWGVFEDVFCAGKDSTFLFLQDVIDEVLPLFPSQFIHVGGDEAPKSHWKKCPACQARIKAEGLKDEHELQSYFITRMEKYINSKGKTIIGWDEILEGGLAPNAVVMSWRGEKGGIEAARQKHKVIMTPQKPLYFDHSQTKNEDSLVIGGFNPIEEVYAYDPVSKELSAEDAKFILGAQANLWTEYIASPSKAEYMLFPRLSALSEVLWSPKEKRNWKNFEKKLPAVFIRYGLWKTNYSKAFTGLNATISSGPNGTISWALRSNARDRLILLYNESDKEAKIANSIRIPVDTKAGSKTYFAELVNYKLKNKKREIVRPGEQVLKQKFYFNKATGKKVSITATPNEKYPGQGGAFSLVNGVYSNKGLSYPDWLGWIGDDMEATIDLGKTMSIDSVRIHTLNQNGSWIYLPQYVEVLFSKDGKHFSPAGRSSDFVSDTLTMGWINVSLPKKSMRYIKVVAKNYGLIPDSLPGAGNKAWLFADEIQVY